MFLEQRTRPLVRAPGAGRGAPAASPASLCAGADRTAASMPGKEQLGAGAGGDVCGKDPQPPDTCWGHSLAPTPRTLFGPCQALWVLRLICCAWESTDRRGREGAACRQEAASQLGGEARAWARWVEGTSQQSTGSGASWVRASRAADGLPWTRAARGLP